MSERLSDQILALAGRVTGMLTADVMDFAPRSVAQACGRLSRAGQLVSCATPRRHTTQTGSPENCRRRYFTDSAACEAWADASRRSEALCKPVRRTAAQKAADRRAATEIRVTTATRVIVAPLSPLARYGGQALSVRLPSDLPFVPRDGSLDFAQHPSRSGGELRYRDGRRDRVEIGAA